MASDTDELRTWYTSYLACDQDSSYDLVRDVMSDHLDQASTEQRIHSLASSIRVAHGYCSTCQDMLDNWPLRSYTLAEQESYHSQDAFPPSKYALARTFHTIQIEASARSGCKFCALLFQILKDWDDLDTFRRIEARLDRLGEPAASCLSVETCSADKQSFWVDFPNRTPDYEAFHTTYFDCVTVTEDEFPRQNQDVQDTSKAWLRTCVESHKSCNTWVENRQLPTRLVSIASDKPRVEIMADRQDSEAPLKYATLSYCWGKRPFIQLTKHNLQTLMEEMPSTDIPQTFTDAFAIAKSLGIDYIWVDSLCIIQDDEDDWLREADGMRSVYAGSHVNIAASSATDVFGGCFVKTPPYYRDGLQVKVNAEGIAECRSFAAGSLYERSVLDSHLMTRGWALQEKMLPPRTIHFGNTGAFWECRESLLSEFHPADMPSVESFHSLVYGDENENEIRTDYLWRFVVKRYSAANLTKRQDKFAALAGIARAVADATGDEYLAGLWKRDIEFHLCWSAVRPERERKRRHSHGPDWLAPSWSWASIEGPVSHLNIGADREVNLTGDFATRFAHVYNTEMTFLGVAPFGQLSWGVLYLRCSVILSGWLRKRDLSPEYPDEFWFDVAWAGGGAEETLTAILSDEDKEELFRVRPDSLEDFPGNDDGEQMVYLVPLVEEFRPPYGSPFVNACPEGANWQLGLVLRQTGKAPGEFYRIGYFEFEADLHVEAEFRGNGKDGMR
ncbi:HET-domain-containing protein [Apiospora sp. TS-2023a]